MQTLITRNNPENTRFNVSFRDMTAGELMALNAMLARAKTAVQDDVQLSFTRAAQESSAPEYIFA